MKAFLLRIFYLLTIIFSLFSIDLPAKNPKISIITSLYNGDEFIEGFMEDIVRQTIFDDCELIIINAASPGHEEIVIQEYMNKYKNIVYKRIEKDPGIYAVWNMAIALARGEFITNANVDDRLAFNCYEIHLKKLIKHPNIDLVYSDCYITKSPNETFEDNSAYTVLRRPEFSKQALRNSCLPNNHPMWRKSMHEKYGYFDETFKIAGDWDMWLRAAKNGSVFLKVKKILGLYYENPRGLSTDQNGDWKKEFLRVYNAYKNI